MKKRCARFWSHPAALPLACYLLAAVCWLALGVYGLLADRGLTGWEVPAGAFEMADLAPDGLGGYVTLSGDPQMIWENTDGRRVRTLSYVMEEQSGDLREVCLYYTTAPGQPFSARQRVFSTRVGERYVFTLPRVSLAALRLDPCSPGDSGMLTLRFAADSIEFNAGAVLPHGMDYFRPGWHQLFGLVLYPALAAAVLDWLRAVVCWLRKR